MNQSHLAILGWLMKDELSGRELQSLINWNSSAVAFYHEMALIEDQRWVKGFYKPKIVMGQEIKERWFVITEVGSLVHRQNIPQQTE